MRVVGYVRESPTPQEADPAFAQTERVRRTATEGGHHLVAVCQDVPQPGLALGREGYLALLGIVDAGQVDGVLVSSLTAFSPDALIQEIIIWDLRRRGVVVLSAEGSDVPALADPPHNRTRIFVRDVLARVGDYFSDLGEAPRPLSVEPGEPDVVVELISQSEAPSRSGG